LEKLNDWVGLVVIGTGRGENLVGKDSVEREKVDPVSAEEGKLKSEAQAPEGR